MTKITLIQGLTLLQRNSLNLSTLTLFTTVNAVCPILTQKAAKQGRVE